MLFKLALFIDGEFQFHLWFSNLDNCIEYQTKFIDMYGKKEDVNELKFFVIEFKKPKNIDEWIGLINEIELHNFREYLDLAESIVIPNKN